jgi:PKD repeat protein
MGPGPAHAQVNWTLRFEEAGEFLLTVNASCIDTQKIPQWMNASTTIRVYAPPHVEFEYTPEGRVYANDTTTFNATKSFGRGPNSLIATYAWDFGDGTNATTFIPTIQHKFLKIGNYTISLNVTDDSAFELSSTNTTEISVSLFGDINFDGQVNIVDITIVATAFGSEPETPTWNPKADLNKDGTVNIVDITLVAKEYGKVA